MQINYFTNSEPSNRLNPIKCPFCSPSSLMCGWSGHNAAYPSPQTVGAAEQANKPAPTRQPTTIFQVRALACYPDGQRRVAFCIRSTDDIDATLRATFDTPDFRDVTITELPLYSGPSLS